MTNIEAKILELEGKVTLPDLHNEVVIEDGDQRVKYVAETKNLWACGLDIRGLAILSRPDINKSKWRSDELVWKVYSERIILTENTGSHYFLSNGKSATGESCSSDYRGALKGEAANQGIKLSSE